MLSFAFRTLLIFDIGFTSTESLSITPVHIADPKQQSDRDQSTVHQNDAYRFMRSLG